MAALELPYVELADALAICVLMRRHDDRQFERAAVRWLARLGLEHPGVRLAELHHAAAALIELPSSRAEATLVELCRHLGLGRPSGL